jgi:PhnB protein
LGNTEEAFNFYKSVFGGEFLSLQRFGDIPTNENSDDSANDSTDNNKNDWKNHI